MSLKRKKKRVQVTHEKICPSAAWGCFWIHTHASRPSVYKTHVCVLNRTGLCVKPGVFWWNTPPLIYTNTRISLLIASPLFPPSPSLPPLSCQRECLVSARMSALQPVQDLVLYRQRQGEPVIYRMATCADDKTAQTHFNMQPSSEGWTFQMLSRCCLQKGYNVSACSGCCCCFFFVSAVSS